MPLLQAIDASGRTMSNDAMSREVLDALPGVAAGRSLGECLSFSKDLPELLAKMTAVGETTGSMEPMLQVLAVFVVFVLLAVYLPMFGMYGSI